MDVDGGGRGGGRIDCNGRQRFNLRRTIFAAATAAGSSYVGDGGRRRRGRAVADFVIFARKVDAPRSRSPPPPPLVLPRRRLRLEFSPPVRFRLHFDSSQRGLLPSSFLPCLPFPEDGDGPFVSSQ